MLVSQDLANIADFKIITNTGMHTDHHLLVVELDTHLLDASGPDPIRYKLSKLDQ